MNQYIEMLQKQAKNTPAPVADANPSQGQNEQQFRQIFERLDGLTNEMELFKQDFARWAKEIHDSLSAKAELETVKALENSLLERLNEIVRALSKQFADKTDTRKALKLLEKNLKNMYDLFVTKGAEQNNEDDAMFTTKPLGGTSCASCAKDVIDMYGKKVDYLPWGKLPFRDPSERIARVGQGFSKMLSMINPDQLSQMPMGYNNIGSQDHLQYESGGMNSANNTQSNKRLLNRGMSQNKAATGFGNNFNKPGQNEIRPNSAQVAQQRVVVSLNYSF